MDEISIASHDDISTKETSLQGPQPLLLPEILLQIAPMLNQSTIWHCVLVCKTWHTCLMPFLFQRINLPRRKQIKRSKLASRPLISTLKKNAPSIRTLVCADSNSILRQITPGCTGLETLVLGDITSEILPVLRLCKDTLRQLELMPSRAPAPLIPYMGSLRANSLVYQHRGILEAILDLSKLRHLVLDHLGIKDEAQLDSFFEFCTQLTSLELHNNGVVGGPPSTLTLNNLRSISLVDSSMQLQDQLMLLWRCPSLDHITWIQKSYIMPMESFGHLWKDDRQELKSLDISTCNVQDVPLSSVITQLSSLEILIAQDTKFGPVTLTALLTNLKDTIRVLDLVGCQAVTPEMTAQILESCPSLKSLSADRLRALQVMGSRHPWVCHGLEELRVVFTGPSLLSPYETQHAIYNQIATFRQLRVLNLGRYRKPSIWLNQSVLDLSLAGGLHQLAPLKELRVFDFCQLDHKLTIDELKFMLKSWPKLDTLHGQLNGNHDRVAFIESFLKNERPWLRVRSSMKFERRETRTEL